MIIFVVGKIIYKKQPTNKIIISGLMVLLVL